MQLHSLAPSKRDSTPQLAKVFLEQIVRTPQAVARMNAVFVEGGWLNVQLRLCTGKALEDSRKSHVFP